MKHYGSVERIRQLNDDRGTPWGTRDAQNVIDDLLEAYDDQVKIYNVLRNDFAHYKSRNIVPDEEDPFTPSDTQYDQLLMEIDSLKHQFAGLQGQIQRYGAMFLRIRDAADSYSTGLDYRSPEA